MIFTELCDKAKKQAVSEMYNEIQEHRICWEIEVEGIRERVSEILDEYHYHEREIRYEYDYGRVSFSDIETSFNVDELLKIEKI